MHPLGCLNIGELMGLQEVINTLLALLEQLGWPQFGDGKEGVPAQLSKEHWEKNESVGHFWD